MFCKVPWNLCPIGRKTYFFQKRRKTGELPLGSDKTDVPLLCPDISTIIRVPAAHTTSIRKPGFPPFPQYLSNSLYW